jgi:hypothetical protein
MKEPYIEGVAIHGGPESCVGFREGASEALTGVSAGQAVEPRNQRSGVPTSLTEAEATSQAALSASRRRTPRGRRTRACTESPCARTGRSHGRPSC